MNSPLSNTLHADSDLDIETYGSAPISTPTKPHSRLRKVRLTVDIEYILPSGDIKPLIENLEEIGREIAMHDRLSAQTEATVDIRAFGVKEIVP